jgi:dgqhr domain protein
MSKLRSTSRETDREKKEKEKKRLKRKFANTIKKIFLLADFSWIDSENHQFKIGLREIEIDAIFYYENIVLICEYTSLNNDIKDHVRKKHEAFKQIEENKQAFFKWLSDQFGVHKEKLYKYNPQHYRIIYLYFPQKELAFSKDTLSLYSCIKFVEPQYLEYFNKIAQCIHKSIKYEIYRFLNIKDEEVGLYSTESYNKSISATIITPEEFTGLRNGVRIVSFMMSAETLIKNAYVLRKDNWEDTATLYQRLIQRDKIRGIRKFLANKKEVFYNNIIVALPDSVYFLDREDRRIEIDQVRECAVCKMMIPDKMNTIGIIDGQHRIYAHYEGPANDPLERDISTLRKKLHLLVTGLIFPSEMSGTQRAQIESEIFLDINSNAKPVPPDVLLHITGIKYPLSDIGLARAVIERLNCESIFLRKFELSSLEQGKIKIASIIKFALRYLVSIEEQEKKNFYAYWSGNKDGLQKLNDSDYEDYLKYCTNNLKQYFSAVHDCFKEEWDDPESKVLSVISINGFILAYTSFVSEYGVKEFDFFKEKLRHLEIDFSKEHFPYTSSQYKKFSIEILKTLKR